MKYLVIGTAGHIDHGKTELVRTLTGVDTDRLKEEKQRGMTIDLGFAEFQVSEEIRAGIVDVPGHERFVRNMLAGSTGMDLVLLVIAANEGVMPQTREHLAICQLLRVSAGLVVLTKVDLVETEWRELVEEEVRGFVKGTFLEESPIIPVSSPTGEGIETLKRELAGLAARIPPRGESSTFRLPVDRSFTIKGFGTVVTGTVFGGKLNAGDQVVILPTGISTRVKGIETHGRKAGGAVAGQRAALNLTGIEKMQVKRGDVLARPGDLVPSRLLDVHLAILPEVERPLKNWSSVRFHAGTAEVIGKVRLLGKEQLRPGEDGYAQLLLLEPVVAVARDRFVIRQASPMVTIGGGDILDPLPRARHRLRDPAAIEWMKELTKADASRLVLLQVARSGLKGVGADELVPRIPTNREGIQMVIDEMLKDKKIIASPRNRYFAPEHIRDLAGKVRERVSDYHKSNPLVPGMAREELKGVFAPASPDALNEAYRFLQEQGTIVLEEEIIRLSEHRLELSPAEEQLRERFLGRLREAGAHPPELSEIIREVSSDQQVLDKLVRLLVRQGELVRVRDGLYYPADTFREIQEKLVAYLQDGNTVEVGKFKEIFGITRKWAIPLLEYFDASRVTLRVGNVRKLYPKGGGTPGG